MNCTIGTLSRVAFASVMLMASEGCGLKWLQSNGTEQAGSQNSRADRANSSVGGLGQWQGHAGSQNSRVDGANGSVDGSGEWQGQGVNPNFPAVTREGVRGDLSGFSQEPAEERLGHGYPATPKAYAGMNVMQHAELTKEEKAAIDAGLQDVFFSYDRWTLSENGMASLNHDAEWLMQHPGAVMKVEGHCDERGTTDYNVLLGDKRAKSARTYLIELGVNPKQVAIISYGKERPFCLDHTEPCYQQNRRGHVLLKLKK